MPAASVPKEAAFVAPLRGVRPCKETGQLLRGAAGTRGGGCRALGSPRGWQSMHSVKARGLYTVISSRASTQD